MITDAAAEADAEAVTAEVMVFTVAELTAVLPARRVCLVVCGRLLMALAEADADAEADAPARRASAAHYETLRFFSYAGRKF